ncbi:DUF2380 domain-containing protein [Paracoccus sp. S-4012]|uniref:DUF2380 domain-containing protein n=1 Tax=Paracoccus sp. S-4012 TaxID=2665648 RepID=UPI0021063D6A|nr:DUF2380 domain-containing protein [Paracoccus sp. S-4012]
MPPSRPSRPLVRRSAIRARAGAGLACAISGQVQKVSNLTLPMNLSIRDAESGETLAAGAVNIIRGNTDESCSRAYRAGEPSAVRHVHR